MMGSRGDASAQATALGKLTAAMPPQVTALVMLGEIHDLLKSADQILPAAVKDLRAAETQAKEAYAQVEAATAEYDAKQAELAKRATDLDKREASLASELVAAKEMRAAAEARQATFDGQQKALDDRVADLDARQAEIVKTRDLVIRKCDVERAELAKDTAKANADMEQQCREVAARIAMERDRADFEIAEMRAAADAEISRRGAELDRREVGVAAREDAIHKRAAELRALLATA